MYKLLFFAIITLLGILIGPVIAGEQGSVEILFLTYKVEMSVTTLFVLFLLAFFVLYFLFSLLYLILSSPALLGRWFNRTSPKKEVKRNRLANQALLEGNYAKAGELFSRNARHHPTLVNHLQAAISYLKCNKLEQAKSSLEEAAVIATEKEMLSYRLVQLRYLIKMNQMQEATILVKKLFNQYPRNPDVIRLGYEVFSLTNNYEDLMDIFIAMRKIKLFSEEQLKSIEDKTYIAQMNQLFEEKGKEGLISWWGQQPRAIRKKENLTMLYNELTDINKLPEQLKELKKPD